LPCWKIQTRAPKLAPIDRAFMTIALAGRTAERRRTKSTRYVVTMMKSNVRGNSAATSATTSWTSAAPPPTRTVIPAGAASGPVEARRSRASAWPSGAFGPSGV
jgi:hypothetical protein